MVSSSFWSNAGLRSRGTRLLLRLPQAGVRVLRRHAEYMAVRITQLGQESVGLTAVLGGVRRDRDFLLVAQQQILGQPAPSEKQRRQRLQRPGCPLSGVVLHVQINED